MACSSGHSAALGSRVTTSCARSPARAREVAVSATATSVRCLTQLGQRSPPMCQFYEATGPDAARLIDSLRAGCVDQGSFHAKVVDECPKDGNVGGCKTPVTVEGGANVQLYLTNF